MTERDIQKAIYRKWMKTGDLHLTNAYLYFWESDYWFLMKSGYAWEIEIKISRADFFNDFKKTERHTILQTGKLSKSYWRRDKATGESLEYIGEAKPYSRPNKFFYAVPEGLIKESDVPNYAGLLVLSKLGRIKIVRQAPFLHKEVFTNWKGLCGKFYWKWKNCETK